MGTKARGDIKVTSHTRAPVSWHGKSAARSALRLTVTFKYKTAKSGSEEGQHSGGDGCRSCQGKP